MNISNPRYYGPQISGNWPQDIQPSSGQQYQNSFPPTSYMQQSTHLGFYPYPTAPQYPPPPPPYLPPTFGYQVPTQDCPPPIYTNLNQQQPYNPSGVGPPVSNTTSVIPSRPAPPGRQSGPHYPQQNWQNETKPNRTCDTEPSIGFMNLTNETSLYPSLQGSERQRNRNHTETPLPNNLFVLWESSRAAKLYFVQQEGHIVSSGEDLIFRANKFPTNVQSTSQPVGSLSGQAKGATLLVTMEKAWRLGLNRDRSYLVKGSCGEIAFYDTSTSPARFVIVILPKEVTKEDRQRLLVLLQASSRMVDEPSNVVDKFESGIETVFDSLTSSVDSIVKKGVPTTVHKNTKWLRKGTGNLVRLGGGIVSKGVHLVSDGVMTKEVPKDSCQQHKQLFEALKNVRQAIENKTVTTVLPL